MCFQHHAIWHVTNSFLIVVVVVARHYHRELSNLPLIGRFNNTIKPTIETLQQRVKSVQS